MKLLTTKTKSYNYTFLFYRQGLTRFEFMLHHTSLLFIKYLPSLSLSLFLLINFFFHTFTLSYKNTKTRKLFKRDEWLNSDMCTCMYTNQSADRKFDLIHGIILITPCPGTHYTCNVSCFCQICCQLSMFSTLLLSIDSFFH